MGETTWCGPFYLYMTSRGLGGQSKFVYPLLAVTTTVLSLVHIPHTFTLHHTEIPALPPPVEQNPNMPERSESDIDWGNTDGEETFKRTSGPKVHDPYASDDSWFMPITLAVAVFLPVLFCLCRVR